MAAPVGLADTLAITELLTAWRLGDAGAERPTGRAGLVAGPWFLSLTGPCSASPLEEAVGAALRTSSQWASTGSAASPWWASSAAAA